MSSKSKVEVEVGVRSGAVASGLAKVRGQFADFRKHLNSDISNVFTGAALLGGINRMREELDRVQKLAIRFGETAEDIQRIGQVASLDGTDIEAVAKAVGKVSLAALKAVRDGGEMNEMFASNGINAAEFIGLSLPEKLIALSEAYHRSKGSGEGLARMMELLGKSGGEMIPMLSRGPAELINGFNQASVASQAAVDATAKFNDTLEEIGAVSRTVFGFIVQVLLSVGKLIGAGIGVQLGLYQAFFETLLGGYTLVAKAVASVMTGNISGAKSALAALPGLFRTAGEKSGAALLGGLAQAKEDLGDIWSAEGFKGPSGETDVIAQALAEETAEAAKKADEEAEKRATEIADLKKKLGEAEHERLLRNLDIEERINQLILDRQNILADGDASGDEKKQLEAQVEAEKITQKIEQAQKEQADTRKREAEDMTKGQERLAELQRENSMDAMSSDQERLDLLRSELANLNEQVAAATDPKEALDLRIKREEKIAEVSDQADKVDKEAKEKAKKQNLAAVGDSMAEIGGGGNISAVGSTIDPIVNEQKATNELLRQIYEQNRFSGTSSSEDVMRE